MMSKTSGILLIVVVVLLAGMVLPNFFPGRVRTSCFEQYLCRKCAVKREVRVRRFLDFTYSKRDRMTSTALSRCMSGRTNATCPHQWTWIYHDFHEARESGHGGVRSRWDLLRLCDSTAMASGIVRFAESEGLLPEEVWRTILVDFAADRRDGTLPLLTEAIHSGCIDEATFDTWLKDHYANLKGESAGN